MPGGFFLLDPDNGLTEMAETAFAAEVDLQELLAQYPRRGARHLFGTFVALRRVALTRRRDRRTMKLETEGGSNEEGGGNRPGTGRGRPILN